MPAPFTGTGQLSYNRVHFPYHIESSWSTEVMYDSANRAAIGTRYTLTVQTVFYDGQPGILDGTTAIVSLDDANTGTPMLRKLLEEEGGHLQFTSKGFGSDFAINSVHQDLSFGPKPRITQWDRFADNKAVQVTWVVTVEIKLCDSSAIGPLKELNYGMSWSIAEDGTTSRSISGNIDIIPILQRSTQEHAGLTGRLQNTADAYRNRFHFALSFSLHRNHRTII